MSSQPAAPRFGKKLRRFKSDVRKIAVYSTPVPYRQWTKQHKSSVHNLNARLIEFDLPLTEHLQTSKLSPVELSSIKTWLLQYDLLNPDMVEFDMEVERQVYDLSHSVVVKLIDPLFGTLYAAAKVFDSDISSDIQYRALMIEDMKSRLMDQRNRTIAQVLASIEFQLQEYNRE